MSTKIVKYGTPILHQVCEQTDLNNPELPNIIKMMQETMVIEQGVGLAANQIGLNERIFVWDYAGHTGHLINPEIYPNAVEFESIEGCLSCGKIPVKLHRSIGCEIGGYELDGEWVTYSASTTLGCIFQHEVDHLNGKTIFDNLNRQQRRNLWKQ